MNKHVKCNPCCNCDPSCQWFTRPSTDRGQKFDEGKLDFTLLEPAMLEAYTRIRMYGNQKYAPDSWKEVPGAYKRYLAAALRHLLAELEDKYSYDESGMPHLWHALCNLGFLCYFMKEETSDKTEDKTPNTKK